MNVLVTGGAGFIGSHLVDALVGEGHRVIVFDDLSSGKLSNLDRAKARIQFIKGDIRDYRLLTEALGGCQFVFHMAAMVSVVQTIEDPLLSSRINETGTLNVLEACRKNGVKRVVFSSSSAVYGNASGLANHEKMTPEPMSPYAVQKLTGENYAGVYHQLYGLETVCLRYFNVFGPRQDPSSPYSGVISIFMNKAAAENKPVIYGDGEQTRDFVFVKDVVDANMLAAKTKSAAGQVINIGTGRKTTINRLWQLICKIDHSHIRPEYDAPRKGEIRESVASIEKAGKILNFSCKYSMEDALAETYNWYKNQSC